MENLNIKRPTRCGCESDAFTFAKYMKIVCDEMVKDKNHDLHEITSTRASSIS